MIIRNPARRWWQFWKPRFVEVFDYFGDPVTWSIKRAALAPKPD